MWTNEKIPAPSRTQTHRPPGYKCRFEILNIVYLENPWCLVFTSLHQSIVIQFRGMLAELPAILDSFFTSITSDYMG